MHEYDKMLEWVKAGNGSRTITIDIGKYLNATYLRKRAFDYDLMIGQTFDNIDDVNLEKVKEDEDRKKFEELKNKFKGD